MNPILLDYLIMAYTLASFASLIAGIVFRAFNMYEGKLIVSVGMIVFPTFFVGYGMISMLVYEPFKSKGQ